MKELKNIPDRWFMNIGEEEDIEDFEDFNDLKDADENAVTFTETRNFETDIEYIRASKLSEALKSIEDRIEDIERDIPILKQASPSAIFTEAFRIAKELSDNEIEYLNQLKNLLK